MTGKKSLALHKLLIYLSSKPLCFGKSRGGPLNFTKMQSRKKSSGQLDRVRHSAARKSQRDSEFSPLPLFLAFKRGPEKVFRSHLNHSLAKGEEESEKLKRYVMLFVADFTVFMDFSIPPVVALSFPKSKLKIFITIFLNFLFSASLSSESGLVTANPLLLLSRLTNFFYF